MPTETPDNWRGLQIHEALVKQARLAKRQGEQKNRSAKIRQLIKPQRIKFSEPRGRPGSTSKRIGGLIFKLEAGAAGTKCARKNYIKMGKTRPNQLKFTFTKGNVKALQKFLESLIK